MSVAFKEAGYQFLNQLSYLSHSPSLKSHINNLLYCQIKSRSLPVCVRLFPCMCACACVQRGWPVCSQSSLAKSQMPHWLPWIQKPNSVAHWLTSQSSCLCTIAYGLSYHILIKETHYRFYLQLSSNLLSILYQSFFSILCQKQILNML